MPYMHDRVYDAGLSVLDTEATHIHICSAEPTVFAALNSLGSTTLNIPAPSARTGGGRQVVVPAISGGTVSGSGTATSYAIVDTTNSRLLVAAPLSASQTVTSGNTFSLASFNVGIPAPV
jgi:hypothetical protein